jgi:hypothetical protein
MTMTSHNETGMANMGKIVYADSLSHLKPEPRFSTLWCLHSLSPRNIHHNEPLESRQDRRVHWPWQCGLFNGLEFAKTRLPCRSIRHRSG